MTGSVRIGSRVVGPDHPVYVVAEISANHGGSYERAAELLQAIRTAGADAVKVQTYTADTLTIRSDRAPFQIGGGTLWDGRSLYDLYREAAMPWEWQPRLQARAAELDLAFFSSPFDATAVEFLRGLDVPAYKIASFELVDLPLIRTAARTGRPLLLSTGMATAAEIQEAVDAARGAGAAEILLLKCTSGYPARPEEMHLRTLPDMAERFGCPVGFSDHTLGHTAAVAAVAMGACLVEKHITLSRSLPGPDAAFSLEPEEFRALVAAIRVAEAALGGVRYGGSPDEERSRLFRRSLFVVAPVPAGGTFGPENLRSIRPGQGLHPRYYEAVLGRRAARAIPAGTPLSWDLVEGGREEMPA
jgi:N-acetylneuraminate synthase